MDDREVNMMNQSSNKFSKALAAPAGISAENLIIIIVIFHATPRASGTTAASRIVYSTEVLPQS